MSIENGDTMTTTTGLDLDAIEARAAHLYEYMPLPAEAEQLANQVAGEDVPVLVGEVRRLRVDIERSRRGGKELGKTVEFMAGLIKDAFVRGADDPIAALHQLGEYLSDLYEEEGGLHVDEFTRVYRALKDRRKEWAEVARLREENARLRAELGRPLTADERAFLDGV